ncbi:MAG: 30S ribosomal protein S3 [Clostridia bacterium]|nr:30S ribosomal protein S3 [Clostridia bacterium]
MGQKINPTGLRIGVIKDWESRWYAKKADFGETLVEDYNIREYLLETLAPAGVPKVEIERDAKRVRINIHVAKPGMVIGRGGAEIEKLKGTLEKKLGKPVSLNIIEIKQPDINAQLVAENIAGQLERRISYRRALKQAIGRAMKLGAKGIKCQVSGRLGGAEIARSETYKEGTIPLQTIRADIDYGFTEAKTTYGRLGVKVWIYTGEVLHAANTTGREERKDDRRPRRKPRRDGDAPRRERREFKKEGGAE